MCERNSDCSRFHPHTCFSIWVGGYPSLRLFSAASRGTQCICPRTDLHDTLRPYSVLPLSWSYCAPIAAHALGSACASNKCLHVRIMRACTVSVPPDTMHHDLLRICCSNLRARTLLGVVSLLSPSLLLCDGGAMYLFTSATGSSSHPFKFHEGGGGGPVAWRVGALLFQHG